MDSTNTPAKCWRPVGIGGNASHVSDAGSYASKTAPAGVPPTTQSLSSHTPAPGADRAVGMGRRCVHVSVAGSYSCKAAVGIREAKLPPATYSFCLIAPAAG